MPFARPTLTALRNQALQDVTTSGIPRLDGLLRNAVLRVLAWVMAGLAYSEYGYLDWIARQSVPFTATDEFLEAWAALIGVYRKDATAASGSAAFTGQPGTVAPTGTALIRQDGVPYVTTADGTVDGAGNLSVPFVASITGANTDCDAGTPIGFADPIGGINAGGVTVGPTSGGADQELDDALRTRMLAKYQAPPQGGSAADYVQWALEVPGCTRAWVQPGGDAGTVTVRVMFDDVRAPDGFPVGTDGVATDETRDTPATGDQLLVADHIWPVQPVTALVYVRAPVALPVDVTLLDLEPNTTEMIDTIEAALDDVLRIKGTLGAPLYPSDIYEGILATPGIEHFTMSVPSAPIVPAPGELPVKGTLTVT